MLHYRKTAKVVRALWKQAEGLEDDDERGKARA